MVRPIGYIVGVLVAVGGLALTPLAYADVTVVKRGEALLPASGLVVDLPGRPEGVYNVSGSWALDPDGVFDARDTVDEISPEGAVTAGNRLEAGYFTDGCSDLLANEKLEGGATSEQTLWGSFWQVRVGVFTFDNGLGRRPAAKLCRSDGDGPSILLYRFLTSAPESLSVSAILADVRGSAVLGAMVASFNKKRSRVYVPLSRPDLRNRGSQAAARTVVLEQSGLSVDLPEDGFVWLANAGDGSDFLERVLPQFAEASFEVAVAAGATCADAIKVLEEGAPKVGTRQGQKARNLPSGWIAGPSSVSDDGAGSNPVACYNASFGALLLILMAEGSSDFAPYKTLLAALTRAKRVR